jgi:hypothetical protein
MCCFFHWSTVLGAGSAEELVVQTILDWADSLGTRTVHQSVLIKDFDSAKTKVFQSENYLDCGSEQQTECAKAS